MVDPAGLEPATAGFGDQHPQSRGGSNWWMRRESNSHFLLAGQAASRWLTHPSGRRPRSRTALSGFAGQHIAALSAVVKDLERMTGVEPVRSGWRPVMQPLHHTRSMWYSRPESNQHRHVRSVASYPLNDGSTYGAGDGNRTRVSRLGTKGATSTPRPLISQRTPTTKVATVAGVEPAGRGFGDRTSTTTSRPWVERRESNSLTAGSQPAPAPFGFAQRTKHGASYRTRTDPASLQGRLGLLTITRRNFWSYRRDSNPQHPRYQRGVQPIELRQPTDESYRHARRCAATAHVWRLRPGSNRYIRRYEGRVLPLALRSHWRTRPDLNRRSTP